MKKLFVIFFALCSFQVNAQIQLPSLSPISEIKQEVGDLNVEIHYGRPAARGRKIMGGLVHYGTIWRTGAGPSSTISFNQPVVIGDKSVAAGIYALVSIPNREEWTFMLNADTSKIYVEPGDYDQKFEATRFVVKPEKVTYQESLSISTDIINNDVRVTLSWETTQLSFMILTGVTQRALAAIDDELAKGQNDPDVLGHAADFYLRNGIRLEEGIKLTEKAFSLRQGWWYLETKIALYSRMKKFDKADAARAEAIAFINRTKPQYGGDIIQTLEKTGNDYR